MLKIKRYLSVAILLGLVFIVSACGSANSDNANVVTRSDSSLQLMSTSAADPVYTASQTSSSTETTASRTSLIQQMLIYKGELSINTEHFDDTLDVITKSLASANGYIVAQEDRSGDYANQYTTLEVRIPSSHFFSWVEGIELIPNTKVTKHIYTEDVSEEFVDLQAREKAKQAVIDKYLEYIQLAQTADELIRFTNELAALQEEIEAVQARIRYLSNQVNYSTVTVLLRETKESAFLEELQIGAKFKDAFETGFSGAISLFSFIISSIIVLLPLVVLALIVWGILHFIVLAIRRSHVKKMQPINELVKPIDFDNASSSSEHNTNDINNVNDANKNNKE